LALLSESAVGRGSVPRACSAAWTVRQLAEVLLRLPNGFGETLATRLRLTAADRLEYGHQREQRIDPFAEKH
jgi:hypothetical protein